MHHSSDIMVQLEIIIQFITLLSRQWSTDIYDSKSVFEYVEHTNIFDLMTKKWMNLSDALVSATESHNSSFTLKMTIHFAFFFCTPFQQWCRLIEMFFLWVVTANSFYSQNSISKIYASEKYLWQALWAIFLWDNKLESKATMRYLQAQC